MEQNIITLTQEEHDLAVKIGAAKYKEARRKKLYCGADEFHPYSTDDEPEWCHLLGALCECAEAKYLRAFWNRLNNWFDEGPDIGTRISVRGRSVRKYGSQWSGLLLRPADLKFASDLAFACVVPVEPKWDIRQFRYDATGWVYRRECEAWGHWENYNGRRRCLIVDRERQRSMSELLGMVKSNPSEWGIKPLKPEPLFRD